MEQTENETEVSFVKLRQREENDRVANLLRPYCRFLVRFPSVMVACTIFILAFSIVLSVIPSLGAKDFPDFSKPTKGFEPRGTSLANRFVAFVNLKKFSSYGFTNSPSTNTTHRRTRSLAGSSWSSLHSNIAPWIEDCFLIYEESDSGNLLNEKNMKEVCDLHHNYVESRPEFSRWIWNVHHIPNYIAKLSRKSFCKDITQSDVNFFKSIMLKCAPFYKNGALKNCLDDSGTCGQITTSECRANSNLTTPSNMVRFVYNVFHYLAHKSYANDPSYLKLTSSASLTNWDSEIDDIFFKPIYENHLKDLSKAKLGDVKVVAFNMVNLKFHLFQTDIIIQSLFIIAAIIIVIIFIWFFSGSLFIGLMTIACIIIALALAYFVYGRVFNMNFFPFLNMLTLIFIVGIGADDAFVYTGIWSEALRIYADVSDFEERLIKCTIHAIRHALVAMFVTSLTTAAAFYANVTSVVTSVKCFGLFAGTSIIVNYLLMVTFFPVAVILHEKYIGPCMHGCCPTACRNTKEIDDSLVKPASRLHQFINKSSYNVFEKYLPKVILKGKFIWLVILLAFGIAGCVITFEKPGLNPPSSGDFQMFIDSNALEQYGLTYKKEFNFGSGNEGYNRRAYFVFGVEPEDNGYKFDPDDYGTLKLTPIEYLDIGVSQVWVRQFCQNVQSASFIKRSKSCSNIELFYRSLELPCYTQHPGCCNQTIPMDNQKFTECFRLNTRDNAPVEPDFTKPIFDQRGNLRALVFVGDTKYVYSDEFNYNKDASDTIAAWFDEQTRNATSPTFKGWWLIFNKFYDLQLGLFEGTKQSLGIAIAVAFLVILFTTFNIILSLYSILTITFIISVTVGFLVLSGWKLNILESIVFSVAAGLSTDFTLHYSVAYQTSSSKLNRIERVNRALSHIGPAILMGAVTTFIAGLVMAPSHVLVYVQMSHFLMLVMFISWVYSTLFFLPLCSFLGPVGNLGRLTCNKFKRKKNAVSKSSNSHNGKSAIQLQQAS